MSSRRTALLLATTSVVLWGFFTLLADRLRHVPPFLFSSIGLIVGGLTGLPRVREWRVPPRTFAIGAGGLFGYHALLFSAYYRAPILEASLLNYLWPLLVVLLTPVLLAGHPLRAHHVAGGVLGLCGAALIVTGGQLHPELAHLPGYLLAVGAAFAWALYSLLTKREPPFPSAAVGGFCLTAGVVSLAVYLALSGGAPVWPDAVDWPWLVLVGVGPMGIAFYCWDAAVKRGDPRVLGSFSYLTPLLSTLILIAAGGKRLTWITGLAMVLIIAGAIVGARPERSART